MSKEIKDYLHLYYGVECIVEKSDYHMVHNLMINAGDKAIIDGKFIFHVHNAVPFKGIVKPILRPLSDMTEEESKELLSIQDLKRGVIDTKYVIVTRSWEDARYLLSKHFDLFGLIESGLAIDVTTLNQKK